MLKAALLASLASALVVPRPRGRGLTAPRSTFDQSVGDDDSTLSFMAARAPSAGDDAAAAIAAQLGFAVALPQPAAARAAAPAQLTPAPPGLPALGARAPPPLELQLAFEREGHCVTRALLDASEIGAYAPAVLGAARRGERGARAHAADVNAPGNAPPFLQTFNPHRADGAVAALAGSARLGATAAALLGAPRVRLYQTAVFTKRPGDAATQWHSDLHTSPLDANGMVTCWLALHAVPSPDDGGSALVFAARSHRDLALAMYAVADEGERPDARYCYGAERYDGAIAHHGALAAGDATWHHGWCLHSASALDGGAREERVALALTYVEDGARTLDAAGLAMIEDEDAPSYAGWLAECEPGAPIDHPLLPLVPTE